MSRLIFLVLLCAVFADAAVLKTEIRELVQKVKAESRAFVTISEKEYFVGTEFTLMWVDAIEFCNALDMSLASIETTVEYDAINAHLTENSFVDIDFWISLKELEPTLWMWVGSGQIATEVNWSTEPVQPDNSADPINCVHMRTTGWYDDTCSLQKNFICE